MDLHNDIFDDEDSSNESMDDIIFYEDFEPLCQYDKEEIVYVVPLEAPANEKIQIILCETGYESLLDIDSAGCYDHNSSEIKEDSIKTNARSSRGTQTFNAGPRQKWTQLSLPNSHSCATFVNNALIHDMYANNAEETMSFDADNIVLARLLAANIQPLLTWKVNLLLKTAEVKIPALFSAQIVQELSDSRMNFASVVSIDWNSQFKDIFAAGLAFQEAGGVAVFSLKNSLLAERFYRLPSAVSCVSFSKKSPNLLAVGMRSGNLWIIDISCSDLKIMHKIVTKPYEIIEAVQWWDLNQTDAVIFGSNTRVVCAKRPFVAHRPNTLTTLVHYNDQDLQNIGAPLTLGPNVTGIVKNDFSNGLVASGADGYLRSTNMGLLHYNLAHNGSVCALKPIPLCPQILVTCGSDGFIKLWKREIEEAIISCQMANVPLIDVSWSPRHATVVVAISMHALHIWDIRRQTHAPVATHEFPDELLNAEFSICGKFITIGTGSGKILFICLVDMPPPEYLKKESFIRAVNRILETEGKAELGKKITKNLE